MLPLTLKRTPLLLTPVRYKAHVAKFDIFEPMRPVSRTRMLNPVVEIPKTENAPLSYFSDEPMVTEYSALEEVLQKRANDVHYQKPTEEQKAERRILNRLETQRLKHNVDLVWDRIQTIHEDMRITSVKPTVRIYVKTINALVQCTRIDKAHEMFAKMRQLFNQDEIPGFLVAYMIQACYYTKDVIRGQGYMDELLSMLHSETRNYPNENRTEVLITAFNNLINLYSQANNVERVEATLTQLRAANLEPNARTLENVGKVYANTGDFDALAQVLDSLPNISRDENSLLLPQFSNLLIRAAKPENITSAVEIFENMQNKDWRAYDAMLEKYRQANEFERAYQLYERIKIEKVKIKQPIFATLLNICYTDGITPKPDLVETLKQRYYGTGYVAPLSSFNMHRIRRYWRDMHEVYRYKEREPIVVQMLQKILRTREEHIKAGTQKIASSAGRRVAKQRTRVKNEEQKVNAKQAELRARLQELEGKKKK